MPWCVAATSPSHHLTSEFGLLIKQQLYFDRYTKILAPTLDPLRDSRMQMQMKDQEGRAAEDSQQEEEEGGPGEEGEVDGDVDGDVDDDAAAGVFSDGGTGAGIESGAVSDVNVDENIGGAREEVWSGVAGEVAPTFAGGALSAEGVDSDVVSSVDSKIEGGAKVKRNKSKKRKKNRKKDRRASSPSEVPLN